jgi:hypothetical protein
MRDSHIPATVLWQCVITDTPPDFEDFEHLLDCAQCLKMLGEMGDTFDEIGGASEAA